MENRINLIITFQDYLDSVNFFSKSLKDQVAYMMYYIINVSELRSDMQPEIICHRINDQIRREQKRSAVFGIEPPLADEAEVRQIICDNLSEDFELSRVGDQKRDRRLLDDKTAFILSEKKIKSLNKEFNKKLKQRYIRKMAYERIWILSVLIVALLLGSYIITGYFDTRSKVGISLQEFRKRTNLDQVDNEQKAVLFLFYITEIETIKKEMSTQTISDRLYDLSNTVIEPDSIKKYFDSSRLVAASKKENEYRISSEGRVELAQKAKINLDYTESGIVNFWIENTIFRTGGLSITLLGTLIVAIFAFAFQFGKKLNYPD